MISNRITCSPNVDREIKKGNDRRKENSNVERSASMTLHRQRDYKDGRQQTTIEPFFPIVQRADYVINTAYYEYV